MSEIVIKEMTEEEVKEMLKACDFQANMLGFDSMDAMNDFKVDVSLGMIKFGGGFAHFLGHALANADLKNTLIILTYFSNDCAHHAALYRKSLKNREKEQEDNDGT